MPLNIPDGYSGIVQEDPNDISGLRVEFFYEPQLNAKRSKEAGRQIWENMEMVAITVPDHELGGYDRNSRVVHKVDDSQRRRFPKQYAEFQAAQDGGWDGEGMPLTMWAPMTAAKVKEMAALGIHTVEQLSDARLPEEEKSWGDMARKWLAQDPAALQERIADLEAQIEQLTAPKTKSSAKKA